MYVDDADIYIPAKTTNTNLNSFLCVITPNIPRKVAKLSIYAVYINLKYCVTVWSHSPHSIIMAIMCLYELVFFVFK